MFLDSSLNPADSEIEFFPVAHIRLAQPRRSCLKFKFHEIFDAFGDFDEPVMNQISATLGLRPPMARAATLLTAPAVNSSGDRSEALGFGYALREAGFFL